MSGGLGVRRPVIVGPRPPHPDATVIGGCEDVRVVGGDGVDGGVVGLHLPHQGARLGVPELDGARPAARHHDVAAGKIGQATDPVFVSIVETLDELPLAPEVPLLDAGVPGGGPQGVTLDRHALDAVIVRRVQSHFGRDHAALVLRDIEHLYVVILAPGDDVVLVHVLVARPNGQAHDGGLVTS